MALSQNSKILASDVSGAIKSITRSGTTFTYTKLDGTTGTFTQQDNNTTYSAGTGISLSSNTFSLASLHSAAATLGSSSAQTLSYSGTFTIPYITRDIYGRVSGGGTRTMTMPSAPSGGTATALSNVAMSDSYRYLNCSKADNYGGKKLPSGGTWYVYRYYANSSNGETDWLYEVNSISGGSTIKASDMIAIRVA